MLDSISSGFSSVKESSKSKGESGVVGADWSLVSKTVSIFSSAVVLATSSSNVSGALDSVSVLCVVSSDSSVGLGSGSSSASISKLSSSSVSCVSVSESKAARESSGSDSSERDSRPISVVLLSVSDILDSMFSM